MKLIAALICSFLSMNLCAQKNSVIVKFCPLALFDVNSFPTIQGGVEFKLSKKISWYNEFGIQYFVPPNQQPDTSFLSPHGYKIKTELRYYVRNKNNEYRRKPVREFYFAANAFFTHQTYNTVISYVSPTDSLQSNKDGFGVKKDVWGIDLVGGFQRSFGKKFSLDIYAGPGVRFRYSSTVGQQFVYGSNILITKIDFDVNGDREQAEVKGGFSAVPNFSWGIRICYRL
jgi:hypothetical protein